MTNINSNLNSNELPYLDHGILVNSSNYNGCKSSDSQISEMSEDGIKLMSLKDAEKLLIKKALIQLRLYLIIYLMLV